MTEPKITRRAALNDSTTRASTTSFSLDNISWDALS